MPWISFFYPSEYGLPLIGVLGVGLRASVSDCPFCRWVADDEFHRREGWLS